MVAAYSIAPVITGAPEALEMILIILLKPSPIPGP
jgi:hypothetical protein